jgi:PKD repeat protein
MKKIMFLSAGILFLAVSCSKAPVADFSFTSPVKVGEEVTFNNLSKNADRFSWDFGDGYRSTQSDPSHTFGKAGTCTVSLQAMGEEESTYTSKELLITGNTYSFRNGSSVDFQAFYSFSRVGTEIRDFVEHGSLLMGKETVAVITERTTVCFGIVIGETLFVSDEFTLTPDKHNAIVLID